MERESQADRYAVSLAAEHERERQLRADHTVTRVANTPEEIEQLISDYDQRILDEQAAKAGTLDLLYDPNI